ncbi:radical SAM/CxCxxxxC motif protein YfkAB [Paenibacillus psychroresistens]|uniref:Radical SAM/CxCxxxxC motif protein YfkAB n=1 Tax=Paenibacillus psychroresistens TaxID=1778678 RepID=A0A6B8RQK2_9BACL|nr:radical SAM/CxCxxxxC motif protein YfkAB [Paenibacillus psychroresistens]QGQ97825.1 radical SAM/CxCxxxxC motif protein YfkAB [Paenibacillus psychroresistens]
MKEKLLLQPQKPLSPNNDPWEPITSLQKYGKHVLTSVEMTITNLCNMRCEHCAVGDALVLTEKAPIPLADMIRKLEEVEHLETISITGGEPSYREQTVKDYIIPLLKYAKERGVKSQINSNVTLPFSRYELMAPYLDVMHISFNYLDEDDFWQVGFANAGHPVGRETAVKMYERMVDNIKALSKGGMFVSAESMINYRTHTKLPEIHQLISEMGCSRHEVHPMYPSAFAANLPVLSLEEMRSSIHQLLDKRNPELWMLFGTLPFYSCNETAADQVLINRLRNEPNVTVRNDPDGRNRLNVNLFTGEIFVTDFADFPALGNTAQDRLDDVFAKWVQHPLNQSVSCFCPQASCCGPNLLVANSYYKTVDFTKRKAII